MRKEIFEELLKSVKQSGAILRGEMLPSRTFKFGQPDVRLIRDHFGLSQPKFADMLGISVSTLRNWEQGRGKPEGAARILLLVAAKYPETVLEVVHQFTKAAAKKSARAYAGR